MKPFLAWLTFQTPLILTTPVTLDALVIGELALYVGNEEAIRCTPLRQTAGVPHASQIYLADAMRRTIVTKVTKRSAEAQTAPLAEVGTKRSGRQGALSLKDNKFASSLNTYDGWSIEQAFFAGTGNIEEIRHILAELRAIGQRRADGYGLIMDMGIDEVDEDPTRWGLINRNRNAMRPVPLEIFTALGGREDALVYATRARPFYWDAANPPVACAVPDSTDPANLRQ